VKLLLSEAEEVALEGLRFLRSEVQHLLVQKLVKHLRLLEQREELPPKQDLRYKLQVQVHRQPLLLNYITSTL
jgi:hypothetical protein